MNAKLSKGAARFAQELSNCERPVNVREFETPTKSAEQAAATIGCNIDHIVKSLVFMDTETNTPVLVLVSGIHRVDEKKLADAAHAKLRRASAQEVKMATGFAVGGVPPVGHPVPLRTIIDTEIAEKSNLWAAAGAPSAVFEITEKLTAFIPHGVVYDVHTT